MVGRVRRTTVIAAGSDAQGEGPAADVRTLHRSRRGARTTGHEAPHAGPGVLPEPDDPPVEHERVSEDSRAQQGDGSTNEEPSQQLCVSAVSFDQRLERFYLWTLLFDGEPASL